MCVCGFLSSFLSFFIIFSSHRRHISLNERKNVDGKRRRVDDDKTLKEREINGKRVKKCEMWRAREFIIEKNVCCPFSSIFIEHV